jgi:hypothetical protein
MPGFYRDEEQDYNRFWRFAREMRVAQRAGDDATAAECRDEIEIVALHTASDAVRQRCNAALEYRRAGGAAARK